MGTVSTVVQVLLLLSISYFALRWYLSPTQRPTLRSVAIVVLGDVGRSPRMMYHAESFAKNGFQTYIIGNRGTTPIRSLLSTPRVQLLYLPDAPKTLTGLSFLVTAPRKILLQVFEILYALLVRVPHPPEFILVQNPPSIPTLALVWLVSWLRGSKVIIDWHNTGYSILALKLGQDHLFVKIAKWFESYFGRTAYAHLFVTKAMREHLVNEWGLIGKKVVLHDRPPSHFHRASSSEMHELFVRLTPTLFASNPTLQSFLPASNPPYSTPFTIVPQSPSTTSDTLDDETAPPMPAPRPDRPALLVSSTSWTPDEDFSILLEALDVYDRTAREGRLPKVLMVVTGKGPDREKYMREVARRQRQSGGAAGKEGEGWKYVRCVSMWLEAADYPLLLGSADVGISLHSSSSALDLPMKIVDMFGCGLPVCALNFACLHELVKDGTNGLVFSNAEQLAAQLSGLLTDFPSSPTLTALRASLLQTTPSESSLNDAPSTALNVNRDTEEHARGDGRREDGEEEEWEWCSWAQNWDRVMRPLILSDVRGVEALGT